MNISQFEYTTFPISVYFGENTFLKTPDLLKSYKHIFLIASDYNQKQIDYLSSIFDNNNLTVFKEIIQHVPNALVEKALRIVKEKKADVIVAIGGGSAIGLAKGIAKAFELPIIAIPTTYAGSEMTNIWGITNNTGKKTGRSMSVIPKIVLYDPQFTSTMPMQLASTSAMNAMAHLIEAVYAYDTNPITYQNSLMAISKIAEGLSILAKEQKLTIEANQLLQFGAHIAGKSLCEVTMSLHHKVAHVIGGAYNLDHASLHTVLQAYVLEYQWDALSEQVKMDFMATLNHDYPPQALQNLAKLNNSPTSLAALGFEKQNIEKTVDIMLENPYPNPKKLEKEGLIKMLENAYNGTLSHI